MIGCEQPFRTILQGIDVDLILLPDAVRLWSNARPFLPPLTPMQVRGRGERVALDELLRIGARVGERWRVIIGDRVTTRRIDDVAELP